MLEKLRYIKNGELYIPQYFKISTDTWEYFEVRHITGQLLRITKLLNDINMHSRWYSDSWHFTPDKKEDLQRMQLCFSQEISVMAFLGAAKCHFNQTIKEFNL